MFFVSQYHHMYDFLNDNERNCALREKCSAFQSAGFALSYLFRRSDERAMSPLVLCTLAEPDSKNVEKEKRN